jgi:hypothetical protein
MSELHPHWVGDHSQCADPTLCEDWRPVRDDFPPEMQDRVESATLAAAIDAKQALERALNPRAGEKVCIGTPHLNDACWNYFESLWRMAAYDKVHGNHLLHNSGLMNSGSAVFVWGRSTELSHARNTATAAFLNSESDWLLWVDTDIGFEPHALEKLLSVADPDTAPIVGGLCFIEGEFSHDFRGGLRSSLAPTLYDWAWIEPKSGMPGTYKMVARQEWATDAVTRVGATGCGLLLVHRTVFEKISDWNRKNDAPPHIWYDRIPGADGELCGEDISFCLRAHEVGLQVRVHTGVTTTHQKTVWYGAEDYRMKPFTPPPMSVRVLPPDQWPRLQINKNAVQQAAENSPIRNKQVPEALEEVAIIVPIAKRNNAVRFLESLTSSLTVGQRDRVRIYAMFDEGDVNAIDGWIAGFGAAIRAGRELRGQGDEHLYLRSMGSFAEKVNRGYEISSEPWLFLVGDDVAFHPGWLDQAMEVARTTGAAVVGTNDLANPAVTAGYHATHMLIRRSYIDLVGASWDGPGIVCHEGYRHWYVDNEIVEAAKQRETWAPCLAAHVEHLHPLFGKGEQDEVYAIGQAAAEADQALWNVRWAKFRNDRVTVWMDPS